MPDFSSEVRARLASLKLDAARERDIVDEMAQHLDDVYRDLKSRGMSDADALAQTRVELAEGQTLERALRAEPRADEHPPVAGNPGRGRFFAQLVQDAQYAFRSMRRRPGFTAVAVTMLALGIGANTAIFSLVNASLIRRLPVQEPERLSYVYRDNFPLILSYPNYVDFRDKNDVLSDLVAWGGIGVSFGDEKATELVGGAIVTGNYFDVLGIKPALGRVLHPEDDRTPGAHPVVVISHSLWQSRFGARSDIVGLPVRLNGQPFTIVGVAPANFPSAQLSTRRDVFVPMMMQSLARPPRAGYSGEMNPDLLGNRRNSWLLMVGRRKPNVTWAQVDASLSGVLDQMYPDPSRKQPLKVTTVAINDGDPGTRAQVASAAKLLGAVVIAVLLIACVNVANLLLVRANARQREIAVRLSIGASRSRLVRQLLTESAVLALLGGGVGLALGSAMISALRAAPPPPGALPIQLEFALDGTVLAFTAGLALLTSLVFGLVPALRATRPDLVSAIKDESGSVGRARVFGLSGAMVAGQMAVSLLLLVAAGLFLRSFQNVTAIRPGFDADRVVTAPVSLNILRYTRANGRLFYDRILMEAAAVPGAEAAALARSLPLIGFARNSSFTIQGREQASNQFSNEGGGMARNDATSVNVNIVSTGYLKTMGVALRAGRDFAATDDSGSATVGMVNEEFVRRHFPAGGALGARVSLSGSEGPWIEIVGVTTDNKQGTLDEAIAPLMYLPLRQNHESGMQLVVRAAGSTPPVTLVRPVVRAIQAIDANLPVAGARPMSEWIGVSTYSARAGAALLTGFGVLAVLLAAIGLYGVMAFTVSRRTREIGLRMALGASASRVQRSVLRDGLVLALVGVAVGLLGSWWLGGALRRFLYGVQPGDPVTLIAVALVLTAAALLASFIPARRASRVDPIEAMRST
jgi:predicted permease